MGDEVDDGSLGGGGSRSMGVMGSRSVLWVCRLSLANEVTVGLVGEENVGSASSGVIGRMS